MIVKHIQGVNVISIFSGIGASAVGYTLAGLKVGLAVNPDLKSNEIFKQNYPDVKMIEEDITTLQGSSMLKSLNMERFELDILDISPPFNYKSHNMIEKEKNVSLFKEMGRLIEELMPKTFIINAEKFLTVGKNILFLNEKIELFSEIGYRVIYELINVKYYGVPQDKELLVIIGVRNDIEIGSILPESLEIVLSTKDFISDLIDIDSELQLKVKHKHYIEKYFKPGITSREVRGIVEEHRLKINNINFKRDRWEHSFYPLNPTIRAFHPIKDRYLSINEALRLQTFPDGYILSNDEIFNWNKVCGSVPPILISIISENIKSAILDD